MVRLLRRLGVEVDVPGGPDVLRHAAVQLRLSRATRPAWRPRTRQALRGRRARRGAVRLLRLDGARPSTRACSSTIRRCARPRSRWRARTRELSQFLVDVLGVTAVESTVPREGDLPRLLPPPARARTSRRSPRALLRGRARRGARRAAGRRRVLRLRRLVLGAAARGVHRRSSTRSSPTSRPPAPTASWPATRGCLMQMGGGLSRRGSRVRALHLAQVLAGEVDG